MMNDYSTDPEKYDRKWQLFSTNCVLQLTSSDSKGRATVETDPPPPQKESSKNSISWTRHSEPLFFLRCKSVVSRADDQSRCEPRSTSWHMHYRRTWENTLRFFSFRPMLVWWLTLSYFWRKFYHTDRWWRHIDVPRHHNFRLRIYSARIITKLAVQPVKKRANFVVLNICCP